MNKISFISKFRMPEERGIAFALAMMCKSFRYLKWEVELVVPIRRQVKELVGIDMWQYYKIKKDYFSVKFLPTVEILNYTFFELAFSHLRYLILSWVYSLAVIFYLIKKDQKIVYLFIDCKEILLLLRLLQPFYQPFVVYEVHHPANGFYDKLLDRLAINRADLLVANTQMTANFYVARGYPDYRAIGCHVGVNMEDFDFRCTKEQIRKKLKLPINKTIVGYGGRFTALGMEKGISELIAAVTILKKKHRDIFLVCVGGPMEYVEKYR